MSSTSSTDAGSGSLESPNPYIMYATARERTNERVSVSVSHPLLIDPSIRRVARPTRRIRARVRIESSSSRLASPLLASPPLASPSPRTIFRERPSSPDEHLLLPIPVPVVVPRRRRPRSRRRSAAAASRRRRRRDRGRSHRDVRRARPRHAHARRRPLGNDHGRVPHRMNDRMNE